MGDNKAVVDLSKAKKDSNKNPFFVGDMKEAGRDSFINVIIPAIQRIVVDTVRNWIESLVYGGNRPASKSNSGTSYTSFFGQKKTTGGVTEYNSAAQKYATHNVNDFVNYFDDDTQPGERGRVLAEKVCMMLHHDWEDHGCYSVLDFCDYTGQQYTAQANRFGWTHEPIVIRNGRGWSIDLGSPIDLDKVR